MSTAVSNRRKRSRPLSLPARRAVGATAIVSLVALGVGGFAAFPTWPGYDSLYSLLWAREVLDGQLPSFDAYRAPSQHPLLVVTGLVLAPLGDAGARLFVLLCVLSLVALVVAVWSLGRMVAGLLGGVVAVLLVLTRLKYPMLAVIGFLDVMYCALVAWALVLEVHRPRRGGAVWLLLTLAGLLRPEAWLLAGLYAVRTGLGAGARRAATSVALAGVAPLLWALTDFVVTGDPLYSARHVDALAAELGRGRPLHRLPWIMVKLLEEILKPPVLAGGVAGAAAALVLRARWGDDARQRRALGLCGALVAATCATYLVIAVGGLAIVYRYLLPAGVGLIIFCTFAIAGWQSIERGRLRSAWAGGAITLVILGAAWSAVQYDLRAIPSMLERRQSIRDDLVAILRDPAVTAARRCGPLSVPNHKLIPDVRWTLRLRDGVIAPRSSPSQAAMQYGVAIVIERRVERRPELNVREVPTDGPGIQVAPDGFRPLASNRHFAAWAHCPGWAARIPSRPN